MRDRGGISNAGNIQAGGLKRPDCGLTPAAGASNQDIDLSQPVVHGPASRSLSGLTRSERRSLSRTTEPHRA